MHELTISPKPYSVEEEYKAHLVHPRETLPGLRCAWVGDANNILHSMMMAFPKMGIHLAAATPKSYPVLDRMKQLSQKCAGNSPDLTVQYTNSPAEAIKGSDYIVTDTW